MKGNKLKVLVGLLALLLLAVPLFGACADKEEPPAETTLLVGYIGDFSGASALASSRLWTCAKEFFKWANETNYLPGITIEWTEEDDQYDPGQVAIAYRNIMTKDPIVLFTMRAATSAVLKPLVDRDKIPVLSFTGSVATAQEPVGYVFQETFVPEINFNCFLNYVADTWTEDRPCKIASLAWDTDNGRQHEKSRAETAAALGIDFKESYAEVAPAGTMDLTTYLIRIKERNPDYIFFPLLGPATGSGVSPEATSLSIMP